MRPRFFFSIGVTVILLGLLIFFHASAPVRFIRGTIISFFDPALRSLTTLRIWAISSHENEDSMYQQERLAAAEIAEQALTQENDRLRSALGFKEKSKIILHGAGVIHYGKELGREFLLIDQGLNEQIGKGDFVVDANGLLVGMIYDVEDEVAHVRIASNNGDIWDAHILPWGGVAFAKGLGARAFSLELLPQDAVIRMGDYVMTTIHAFAVPVAEVMRVDTGGAGAFKDARATLLSHPERLREVFVISNGTPILE